jgi:hypothetical protein
VPQVSVAPKKRRKWVLVLVGVLALLLIGGGVAIAGMKLGWFSGPQPSSALPGNAVAYFQVDLNPSPNQKLAALDYFKELPQTGSVTQSSGDVKKVLWGMVSPRLDLDVNYETDLKPWLGDRIGIAILPSANTSQRYASKIAVGALQVTNEAVAKEQLPRLLKDISSALEVVTIKNGYAVVTTTDDADEVSSQLAKGVLAQDPNFSSDMGSLGDLGWAAGWSDTSTLASMSWMVPSVVGQMDGQAAFAVRFSDGVLEIPGIFRGIDLEDSTSSGVVADLGGLPSDTGAALSIQGAGDLFTKNWPRISKKSGASLQNGLTVDGVAAFLGNRITASASAGTVRARLGNDYSDYSGLEVGARVTTSSTGSAQSAAEVMFGNSGGYGEALVDRRDGDQYLLASSSNYLNEVSTMTGGLGGEMKFTKAVPDWRQSPVVGYLDLTSLTQVMTRQVPSRYQNFVSRLQSVGFTGSAIQAGKMTWTIRLVRS